MCNHNRVKYAYDHFAKPYLNGLSPGCWSCSRGTWACVFVGLSCTKQCFFCLRRQKEPEDFLPYVDGQVRFDSAEKLVEYLKTFSFDGVAFSGGEPFLAFDRLLAFVRGIRSELGNEHYLWVYTNGDPVTEDKLKRLVESGLNELRMDLAARRYDLKPLELALDRVPVVAVEIPAIPEDVEIVKDLLPRLEAMGVKYLNLHQLMTNDFTREAFEARGYTVTRDEIYQDFFPVRESESAALEVLNHAAERNMRLGINYCSRFYKHSFQLSGFRRRYAPFCLSPGEIETSTGYLRSMVPVPENGSEAEKASMDLLDAEGPPVKVLYSTPFLFSEDDPSQGVREKRLEDWKACVSKGKVAELLLENPTARLLFHLLFVEKKDIDSVREEISQRFETGPGDEDLMHADLLKFHRLFETYEHLDGRMPEAIGK